MIVVDHDRPVETTLRQAQGRQPAAREVSRAGIEEATVRNAFAGTKHHAARALGDVVLGIIAEAAQWHASLDRLRLGRDQRGAATPLNTVIDLAIGKPAPAVAVAIALLALPR